MYLRIYGVEIFKHGSNSPAMYFIVDVIATEMKKVLEQIYHDGWDVEIQNGMLGEMLQVVRLCAARNPCKFFKVILNRLDVQLLFLSWTLLAWQLH